MVLPGGSGGGEAVVTAAGASTAVSSALTSSAVGSAVPRVSGALRVLDCPLGGDDEPRPAVFELPLQASLGGRLGYFAGAALIHALLIAALAGAAWSLQRARRGEQALRVVSVILSANVTYFGPFVLGAVVTVLVHDAGAAQNTAAAVCAALLVLGVRGGIDRAVFLSPAVVAAQPFVSARGTAKQRFVAGKN